METPPGQSSWCKAPDEVRTIQAFARACQLQGRERKSLEAGKSISTCDPGSFNDLDVPNARDNRVVDLEGDSDTKIAPAVSSDHAGHPLTYLYSTPSLIESGFFCKSASLALSARLKMIFLPGGRVGESSSKVNTVT
jgi:hypothetical protein